LKKNSNENAKTTGATANAMAANKPDVNRYSNTEGMSPSTSSDHLKTTHGMGYTNLTHGYRINDEI
jgi:hypothetical protein